MKYKTKERLFCAGCWMFVGFLFFYIRPYPLPWGWKPQDPPKPHFVAPSDGDQFAPPVLIGVTR